jgi:hypothetical protein
MIKSIRQRLEAEGPAIFTDDMMNRAASYVARGRAHAALATAEVKDRWTAAFRSLANGSDAAAGDAVTDYMLELSLRGEQPPFDRVQPELRLLQQAISALEKDHDFQDGTHAAIDDYQRRRAKPIN